MQSKGLSGVFSSTTVQKHKLANKRREKMLGLPMIRDEKVNKRETWLSQAKNSVAEAEAKQTPGALRD